FVCSLNVSTFGLVFAIIIKAPTPFLIKPIGVYSPSAFYSFQNTAYPSSSIKRALFTSSSLILVFFITYGEGIFVHSRMPFLTVYVQFNKYGTPSLSSSHTAFGI